MGWPGCSTTPKISCPAVNSAPLCQSLKSEPHSAVRDTRTNTSPLPTSGIAMRSIVMRSWPWNTAACMIELARTVIALLAFHRAQRQPRDQPALHQRREDKRWQRDQRCGGHQRAPFRRALADEVEGGGDERFGVTVRQHQREQEIVPGEDEGEDCRDRDAGADQRQRNPPQDPREAAAVDLRRLEHAAGDV